MKSMGSMGGMGNDDELRLLCVAGTLVGAVRMIPVLLMLRVIFILKTAEMRAMPT